MQANVILTLLFAAIIALFAIVNAAVVTVSFIFAQFEVSLALVIIISALFGAIVVILFDSFKKIKTKKTIKTLNKKIAELEKELANSQTAFKTCEVESLKKDEIIKEKESLLAATQSEPEKTPQSGE